MSRDDLERLTKAELVELVLKLQRPAKTSRTSSKPPSTDKKARREKSKPGGAKPGHKGEFRRLADDPERPFDWEPIREHLTPWGLSEEEFQPIFGKRWNSGSAMGSARSKPRLSKFSDRSADELVWKPIQDTPANSGGNS